MSRLRWRGRALDADLLALAALGALVLLRFLPDWLRGVTPFWSDLTYLHQPWRAYDAELLTAGRLPLWNPYLYLGMPQAAAMQDSLFFPGTAPFFVFGFPTALAIFEAAHYWLAGALAYLWLRSWRAGRVAAFAGAVLYALSGLMLTREFFINHLAILALAPALALFFTRGPLLSLTLALSFFAGYPPFLIGASLSAWVAAAACARERLARFLSRAGAVWLKAGLGAAALAGCLLLPAVELVRLSRRASGVDLGEALTWGFAPRDLLQWITPLFVFPRFDPAVEWWKCCYLGVVGVAAVIAGAQNLPRRRAAALLAAFGVVVLLTLGSSTPASAWLWAHAPPLRFIRYPGNTAYLAALPLCALAAAGFQSAPPAFRRLAALSLCLELGYYAWGVMPRAPRALLTSPGPLARQLQEDLGGARYMLSWGALDKTSGAGLLDWRHRLYGVSNAPLKIRAVSNFGEPLVPQKNYEALDRLFRDTPAKIAPVLPWLDVRELLTATDISAPGLAPEPSPLWHGYRVDGAADARLLSADQGAALPEDLAAPSDAGRPLPVARPREDAFSVSGSGAGWAFVAEPLFPGWSLWLETPRGPGLARAAPALGPFQKVAVPEGDWTLHWRYGPPSFGWGLALTLGAAGALAAYWYNRARDAHEP